LKPVSKQ